MIENTKHSVSIAFYKRNPSDWASNLIAGLGRLAGYDMSLVHVLFEFDGGYLELTMDGLYFIPQEVAKDELDEPDVRLTFNDISEEEYEAMYTTSELLMAIGLRLHLRDLLRIMVDKVAYGLVCTDIPLLMLGMVPMGLTAYELFEVLLTKADDVVTSDYGLELVKRELNKNSVPFVYELIEDEHEDNPA